MPPKNSKLAAFFAKKTKERETVTKKETDGEIKLEGEGDDDETLEVEAFPSASRGQFQYATTVRISESAGIEAASDQRPVVPEREKSPPRSWCTAKQCKSGCPVKPLDEEHSCALCGSRSQPCRACVDHKYYVCLDCFNKKRCGRGGCALEPFDDIQRCEKCGEQKEPCRGCDEHYWYLCEDCFSAPEVDEDDDSKKAVVEKKSVWAPGRAAAKADEADYPTLAEATSMEAIKKKKDADKKDKAAAASASGAASSSAPWGQRQSSAGGAYKPPGGSAPKSSGAWQPPSRSTGATPSSFSSSSSSKAYTPPGR